MGQPKGDDLNTRFDFLEHHLSFPNNPPTHTCLFDKLIDLDNDQLNSDYMEGYDQN